MKTSDFTRAVQLAKSGESLPDFGDKFLGFGLRGFTPVVCSLKEFASLIRWQACQLCGDLDNEAMSELWENRRRFIVWD